MKRSATLIAALVVVSLTACLEDEVVLAPEVPEAGGELFLRYVSLGNSITAGFQSGGINDSTQHEAYPVILAAQAGADFGVPSLAMPGCPGPLTDPFSGERVGGDAFPCAGRVAPEAFVSNFAVPGAALVDLLSNDVPDASPNTLTSLILGGRTQIEAMLDAEPTLVSVWIGNNDALGAALSGNPAALTPVDSFQARLDAVVEAIDASTAQDAILMGVVDPNVAPALQPGAYFYAVDASGESPVELDVAANCAPGTATGTNFVSFLLISNALGAGETPSIDCADDAPFVLNAGEVATISARVAAFNAAIEAAAAANDWIYVDPNEVLGAFLSDPDRVRKCQGLATATTPEQIATAVVTTCPHPSAPNFFGSLLSFDGVHPSGEAHVIVASALAAELNAKHGLTIPPMAE